MSQLYPPRLTRLTVVLASAALLLGACGAQTAPPADVPAVPTATATPAPTAQPAAPGEVSAPPSPTPGAVAGAEDLPDVPYQMSGYEIIAARRGPGVYSGYTCVLSPNGCACELPAIQEVSFAFRQDGVLEYHFEQEGYAGTWEMLRAAPNEWDYAFTVQSAEQGRAIGEGRVLLTFTETGYAINQLVHFEESGVVICPEVNFRRLPAGEGE